MSDDPDRADNGWRPIETAPKDGTYVDLWVSGPKNQGSREPDCWFDNGKWNRDYGRDGVFEPALYVGDRPTHWKPIPPAPASRA